MYDYRSHLVQAANRGTRTAAAACLALVALNRQRYVLRASVSLGLCLPF